MSTISVTFQPKNKILNNHLSESEDIIHPYIMARNKIHKLRVSNLLGIFSFFQKKRFFSFTNSQDNRNRYEEVPDH